MVNFKIIENDYDDDKYGEWVELYNRGVPMLEMQKVLGINSYKYRKFRKQALSEGKVKDRKSQRKPKYYYRTRHGTFIVNKRNKRGQTVHYGTFKTEAEAEARVKELKKNNWGE